MAVHLWYARSRSGRELRIVSEFRLIFAGGMPGRAAIIQAQDPPTYQGFDWQKMEKLLRKIDAHCAA